MFCFTINFYTLASPLSVIEHEPPLLWEEMFEDHGIIRLIYAKNAILHTVIDPAGLGDANPAILLSKVLAGAVLHIRPAKAPFAVYYAVGLVARRRFLVAPASCGT
jgi:hypothetical protein